MGAATTRATLARAGSTANAGPAPVLRVVVHETTASSFFCPLLRDIFGQATSKDNLLLLDYLSAKDGDAPYRQMYEEWIKLYRKDFQKRHLVYTDLQQTAPGHGHYPAAIQEDLLLPQPEGNSGIDQNVYADIERYYSVNLRNGRTTYSVKATGETYVQDHTCPFRQDT